MKEQFTEIQSNGSYCGQNAASITALLKVLAAAPLDRSFEAYGNFIQENPREGVFIGYQHGKQAYIEKEPLYPVPVTMFWGNFFTVSHVFRIVTNDPKVIQKLTRAIRKNQKRADYLSQDKPKASEFVLEAA